MIHGLAAALAKTRWWAMLNKLPEFVVEPREVDIFRNVWRANFVIRLAARLRRRWIGHGSRRELLKRVDKQTAIIRNDIGEHWHAASPRLLGVWNVDGER